MSATKMYEFDPEIGSPVINEYSDPAMADKIVHFVGRQRGNTPLPTNVRPFTTEARLESILATGLLYGHAVYRSEEVRVTCASDLCAAELETAFDKGLNSRGALEPWAVVLFRGPAWDLGFRPVVYADAATFDQHKAALGNIYGPGGGALAVRTQLGADDWTAEREWRRFFPPGSTPVLDIRAAVAAVIVGRSGWNPKPWLPAPTTLPPYRWLWDPSQRRLVHDGRLPF